MQDMYNKYCSCSGIGSIIDFFSHVCASLCYKTNLLYGTCILKTNKILLVVKFLSRRASSLNQIESENCLVWYQQQEDQVLWIQIRRQNKRELISNQGSRCIFNLLKYILKHIRVWSCKLCWPFQAYFESKMKNYCVIDDPWSSIKVSERFTVMRTL